MGAIPRVDGVSGSLTPWKRGLRETLKATELSPAEWCTAG